MSPGEFRAHLENCTSGHDRQSCFRTNRRNARYLALSSKRCIRIATFNMLMSRVDSTGPSALRRGGITEIFLSVPTRWRVVLARFLGPRPRYELKPLLSRKDSWSLGARNFARSACARGLSEKSDRRHGRAVGVRSGLHCSVQAIFWPENLIGIIPNGD